MMRVRRGDGLVVELEGEADPARLSCNQPKLVAQVKLVETSLARSSVELQALEAMVARSIAAARASI